MITLPPPYHVALHALVAMLGTLGSCAPGALDQAHRERLTPPSFIIGHVVE